MSDIFRHDIYYTMYIYYDEYIHREIKEKEE